MSLDVDRGKTRAGHVGGFPEPERGFGGFPKPQGCCAESRHARLRGKYCGSGRTFGAAEIICEWTCI